MFWLNGNRMRLVLFGAMAAMVFGGGSAKADFTFGRPFNLGPTINSQYQEYDPIVSSDGLELYFCSNRPGGYGKYDLCVSTRSSIDEHWGIPVNLGAMVNGPAGDMLPRLSADGLELYFDSNRSGGQGDWDAWVTKRATKDSAWEPAKNFGPPVNTSAVDGTVWITNDGLELYFSSDRPGGYGNSDLYVSTRATTVDDWGPAINLGPVVNGPSPDLVTCVSSDGLVLFFCEDGTGHIYRSGGFGKIDIWATIRKNRSSPWGAPVNLGEIINTSHTDGAGSLSPDSSILYFFSERLGGLGGSDLYQAPIIPFVDFNNDGIVNSIDMCIMVDYWGTDNQLCDIGPMPWGDGIVDVQDLIIFSEHLFEDLRISAHWEFDETEGSIAYNSIDVSDGICHGEPLWVPNGGKVGGALQFDGIDDYVSIPFVLNPGEGSFSVFAWIQGGVPGQAIISQAEGTFGSDSTWLGMDPSDGSLITSLMHPAFPPLASESVITDGQWHHVGLVYDRDGVHRHLYVDGAEVACDMGPVPAIGSNGGLFIGADQILDAASFFSGLIDDVRIYDVSLTEEEIAVLAQ